LRVAWFTPVQDGAVAEYSRGVLSAAVRLCEPSLFCDRPPDRFPAGIPVRDVTAEPPTLLDLSSFDAVFYNLGNDLQQYGRIYDVARLHSGIVVLHDRTLHRFFLDYYLQLRRPDLYVTQMAEHYGMAGLTTAHRLLGPWFEPPSVRLADRDLLGYPFTEEALRSARAVVVHSRSQGAMVRRLWSGPVYETWLPTQRPTASSIPDEARGGERDDDRITLMTLDSVEPAAHVAEVVDLLAEDRDLAERARYVIVGSFDAGDEYVHQLTAQIMERGLAGSVLMLGPLPPAQLDQCARTADIFVNLRHPEVQGCSMSLMYELAFGKPVITYDSGSFGDVPDDTVAKVAVGDGLGLSRSVRELVDSAPRRGAIGTAGKRFADAHGARDYARELLRFARSNAALAPGESLPWDGSRVVAERIARDVGETLASLGVSAGSSGMETVMREATSLLWPSGQSGS
jgi:glycosyltransferase involved in cell wall biosynthesis